jgi:hypothetical protein
MVGVVAISTISPNSFSARATASSLMVRSPQDVGLNAESPPFLVWPLPGLSRVVMLTKRFNESVSSHSIFVALLSALVPLFACSTEQSTSPESMPVTYHSAGMVSIIVAFTPA